MSFQISTAMIWFLYQSLQRSNTRQVKRGTCFGYCCSKRFRVREICNQNHVGDRGAGAFEGLSLFAWCNHFVREVVSSVTKLLYPTIAKHFKTTDQKVERAIRNAIEVSWSRGNVETFEKIFGYSVASGRTRPTNSEYIARIADNIRLDYKAM